MTNGITATPIEGGFRWPWQTPPGEGFMAPWTPQESYIDPTTDQMMYQPAPPAPTAPMQPMGPNYGPYSDPGQIPSELLELYDWEPFEEQYINEEGKTARITMYRLIPKAGMSEAERRRIELAEAEFMAKYGEGAAGAEPERFPLPSGQAQTTWDDSGMEWFWNEYSGRYEETGRYNQAYDMRLQQAETAVSTPEGMSAYEEDYLRLQRERLAAEQGWKQQEFGLEQQQYAAQLAAQPKSWLEYATYTGQPPVVQPWMKPLMPQQYPELAGLRGGQPIPGWPEQFTGTNVETYGGAYQPWMTSPSGIGTQQATGYGGTPLTGTQPVTTSAGWRPQTVDDYMAMGLSPTEAEKAAEYDRLHAAWRGATPGPEKATAFLTKGQYAAEKPETIARYQQAITDVQSGQPLYGQLSSKEKMQLQTLMGQYGGERPFGYAFDKYYPISSYIDTSIPEVNRWLQAALSGESQTASYPSAPTTPYTPTPTTPYTPTPTRPPTVLPGEEYGLPAPTPKREPTPTYKPTSIPMEESMGNVMAYIPGRSWHDVENTSTNTLGDATWLARMQQLPTAGGTQAAGDTQSATPNWMGASASQGYNPAQYAAGSWAGYNPNLPLGQMPTLTRPSRQYQARMGPTALDQYYAYVQGRTGITPQEMQFRLGSTAPPGGGYSGLRWMR